MLTQEKLETLRHDLKLALTNHEDIKAQETDVLLGCGLTGTRLIQFCP